MTGGDLGQFILYASIVAGAIGALSEVMGEAQRAAGATERLLELMAVNRKSSRPPRRCPCPRAPPTAPRCAGRCGVLVSVAPDTPRWTTSLDIRAGETVAVVGPSGRRQDHAVPAVPALLRSAKRQHPLDGVDIRSWTCTPCATPSASCRRIR
jgi:ATP-binding cassette subfamily B protein